MADDETDHDWLEPGDQGGLWEYQLYPLTVEWLRESMSDLPDSLPVRVEFYDGSEVRTLRPMHIDLQGKDARPSAIAMTVAWPVRTCRGSSGRARSEGGGIAFERIYRRGGIRDLPLRPLCGASLEGSLGLGS
jgi:hypothetical protein